MVVHSEFHSSPIIMITCVPSPEFVVVTVGYIVVIVGRAVAWIGKIELIDRVVNIVGCHN